MKKNNRMKRTCSIFLGCLLVFGMAACNKAPEGGVKTDDSTAKNAETEEPAADSKEQDSAKDTDKDAAADSDVIEISLAHNLAIDSVLDQASKKFADEVSDKTNGKVKITVYPAAQLGNERDMLEGIQMGTIDMMLATTAYISNVEPQFSLLDLPFVFDSIDHVKKCFDGEVGTSLSDMLLTDQRLRIMDYWDSGFRVMMTKSAPLKSLADFKGRSIRAPEVDVYVKMFEALGANPTPIPFGEVYTSMQTGVVDGVEVSAEMMYTSKFFEVGKYIAKTDHIYTTVIPVISEDFYEGLPDDVKTAMDEAMADVTAWEWDAFEQSNTKALEAMVKEGVEVNDIDREELRQVCLPIHEETAKSVKAQDILKMIQEAK